MSAIRQTLTCGACQQPCAHKGRRSDTVVCAACGFHNPLQTREEPPQTSRKRIANNPLLKIGDMLSLEQPYNKGTLLGLQQVYYESGYSNYWYGETEVGEEFYLEESFSDYYFLKPFNADFKALIAKGREAGKSFMVNPEGDLMCAAIQEVVYAAEAGELRQINAFTDKAFVLEALRLGDWETHYRFFIFKSKEVKGFKGKPVSLQTLKSK